MNIKKLLEEKFQGLLKEDQIDALSAAFDEAVKAKAGVLVEAALIKQDQSYADKLQKLVEKIVKKIDSDHAQKLNILLERLDEDRASKLDKVVQKYKKILNEDAKNFKKQLIDKVSHFLDLYLEEAIPTQKLYEAVSNTKGNKILEEIRKFVGIDNNFVSQNTREALKEGLKEIKNLRVSLGEALKQKTLLKAQLNKERSARLLEEKCKGFDKRKKDYLQRVFANKSPDYITENFKYVSEIFDSEQEEKNQLISESAKNEALKRQGIFKTSASNRVIEEKQQKENGDNLFNENHPITMSEYLNGMTKIRR